VGLLGLSVPNSLWAAHPIIEQELPQHVVNGADYFGATTAHHPVHDAAHARDSLRAAVGLHSNSAIEEWLCRHHWNHDDEIIDQD
jgi:hypothetical protein